jgi:L-gulonolactone oxidase
VNEEDAAIVGTRVEPAWRALHYHRAYPRCISMSWAVPIAETARAWELLTGLIRKDAKVGRFPVNMVVHARFIGESRAHLSPAHGGAICDLEAVSARGTPDVDRFHERFADAMLSIPRARPHWGKRILRPETIRARYPAMDGFLAVREQLDPQRVFLNSFLERSVFQLDPL